MKCESCGEETRCIYFTRDYRRICGKCIDKEEGKQKMKKIRVVLLVTVLSFLFWSGPCFADYLVCDPYADGEVDHFLVSIDGQTAIEIPYSLHSSGAAVVFDLSTLGDVVTHLFDIWAVNAQGRRTDADPAIVGDQPVPFDLSAKPSADNLQTIRVLE